MPASALFDTALFLFSILKSDHFPSFLKGYLSFIPLTKHINSYRTTMRGKPLSKEIEKQLQVSLNIKAETYKGAMSNKIFAILNRFFIFYGYNILKIHKLDQKTGKETPI